MNYVRSWLVFGLIIWAVATAVFVPFGHLVFGPDNRLPVTLSVSAIVFATFLGIYGCALRIFTRVPPTLERAALFGLLTCLPGLILDGLLYAGNAGRYPGLDYAASGLMSAGLLFAYAAALTGALCAALRAQATTGLT